MQPGYREVVLPIRSRYLDVARELLGSSIESLGFSRDHLFGYRRFLGEYYCFWLAEALGVTSYSLLEQSTIATALARAYAVLVDAVIDEHREDDSKLLAMANALLRGSIDRFGKLVGDRDLIQNYTNGLLAQAEETERNEQERHWHKLQSFTASDMMTLGKKTSICFLPCIALCLAAKRKDLIPSFISFIEARNVAVQIRDDIADWREDVARCNFTLPLTLSLQPREARHLSYVVQEDVAINLYSNGVIDSLLHLSNQYLSNASCQIAKLFAPLLKKYIDGLRRSNGEFLRRVESLRLSRHHVLTGDLVLSPAPWPAILEFPQSVRSRPMNVKEVAEWDNLARKLHPRAGLT